MIDFLSLSIYGFNPWQSSRQVDTTKARLVVFAAIAAMVGIGVLFAFLPVVMTGVVVGLAAVGAAVAVFAVCQSRTIHSYKAENEHTWKDWLTNLTLGTGIGIGLGAGFGAILGTFVFPGIGTVMGLAIGISVGAAAGLITAALGNKMGKFSVKHSPKKDDSEPQKTVPEQGSNVNIPGRTLTTGHEQRLVQESQQKKNNDDIVETSAGAADGLLILDDETPDPETHRAGFGS